MSSTDTPEVKDMNQSSMQRIAYTAVGIPVHAVNSLMERLAEARKTMEASAEKLSESAREDIDRWALEGEELVERMLRRVRHDGPEAAATMRDTVEGLAATATSPVNDLSDIPGVGEAYAERMRTEGVTTVAAFMTRTADDDSLRRFAAATGITPGRLQSWRTRIDLKAIDGVDEAYEGLLREAGFATVASVAGADPEMMSDRLATQDPDRMPSRTTIEGWIASADALDD
jgi:predicted flap endonuclease-1-like 5' DNA nuclease